MNRIIRHSLAALVLANGVLAQQGGIISGSVTDATSQQPVPGANVYLLGTFLGTTSGSSGSFQLRGVPPGIYTLRVSLIGFQLFSEPGIEIEEGEERKISVSLLEVPVESEQVVVTASRREQSLQEVPVSVSTVTSRMIADRIAVNLDDALRYVPGVNMMQDQVNIRGSTGYSRGVGSRVLVLIDGLPYITGDTGEITWETLPMHQIERIEVVKGAGSALYGSSALGGVINVLTKDVPEHPDLHFRLYSGMYDKPRYQEWDWSSRYRFNSGGYVSYSNRSGELGYLLSLSRSVDESYRGNDLYHRWSFYSKLQYNLSKIQSLSLVANFMMRSHGNFFWWKSLREATLPAESQLNGNVDWKRGSLSLTYKEYVSEQLTYNVKGIYYGNFWRDDSAGRTNNVSASHVSQVEGQGTYKISDDHFLTVGLGTNLDAVNSNIFGSHGGFGAAFYVQDEIGLMNTLKATTGLRYDAQQVVGLPRGSQWNPKIGLVYSPAQQTSVRASFGAGFRYPSISELYTAVSTGVSQINIVPNPDSLKAERSRSYEIGCTQSLFEPILLDAAFFESDYDDLIEARVDARKFVIQFNNVTSARIRGLELGLRSNWLDRLLYLDFSYTYTDPRDLSDNSVLRFRPRHIFYGSALVTVEHFRGSLDFRYISRVEEIDENLVNLAPIVQGNYRVSIKVVDARLSYDLIQLGVPLRVGFNVSNLLNYSYVELIGNLSPLRTYMFSIEGSL